MRRTLAVVVALGIGSGLVSVGAPISALAGECSSRTGGSNDKVMFAGGTKYTCAYVDDNGDNKIGKFATEFFTSSTAKGYKKRTHCWKQSGGVKISSVYTDSGGTNVGSSITFTAINTQDGTRHWTGAVLWNTPSAGEVNGSQFVNSCKGDTIQSNLFRVSKATISGPTVFANSSPVTFTVHVTTPDGGPAPTGGVALYAMAGSKPDPTTKNCDGTTKEGTDQLLAQAPVLSDGKAYPTTTPYTFDVGEDNVYAAFPGSPLGANSVPGLCLAPPNNLLTPATTNIVRISAVAPTAAAAVEPAVSTRALAAGPVVPTKRGNGSLRVLNRSSVTPAAPRAQCPAGWATLEAGLGSPDRVLGAGDLTWTKRGASADTRRVPDGTKLSLQVICRPESARALTVGKSVYGSVRSDDLVTSTARSVAFGGRGNDDIGVRTTRTLAMGGMGGDDITVRRQSAANGGPGKDELVAAGRDRVLLVGGKGQDRLVGNRGPSRLNAADGAAGDTIVCRGTRNRVIADRGDRIVGDCRLVR